MERKIDRQSTYNKYKRKKNNILLTLIIPALIMLGSFLILYFGKFVSMVHVGTVYIVLMVVYLILVFILGPRLQYYKMYADYSRLLINEPKLEKCNEHLFSTSWIDHLKKDGYELVQEDLRHILLCKYYKKLPNVTGSEPTLVFVAIAKNKDFDFYGDELDQGMQKYYMNHKDYEKVIKRVTLQFKKYDMIDDMAKQEVETSILYEAGRHTMINLSFVYNNDGGLLSLDPGGWYPNRYTYFAFMETKRICEIKE